MATKPEFFNSRQVENVRRIGDRISRNFEPWHGNERSSSIEFYLRRLTRSVNRYQPHDNVHSWTCNPVSIYKADFNLLPRTALN